MRGVVGTGIAGLITAYRASERHEVVLVTKSELAESNTKYAQGGIAAALSPDDSVASHVADTLRAGAGLCDPVAVQVLCGEGPQRVRDLVVLASGGAGQLYSHTTNPTVTPGDGVATAWRAGAELADVEFYQFHPTSLAVPGNPLISEAVRGEGAGRTSLPGLFAVGEAACTGVHGANRLASNSLLEPLLFAWRVSDALDLPVVDVETGRETRILELPSSSTGTTAASRAELQKLMWRLVGLERSLTGLREAEATLATWRAEGDGADAGEVANLLELARIIVTAAISREESRGAHDRVDFPDASIQFEYSQAWLYSANVLAEVAS